jgi:HK97 family phage major capsid protein
MKPTDFRITAVIKAITAETWSRIPSEERREHERLCRLAGTEPDGLGAARIPGYALRDLDTTSGSGLAGQITTGGEYVASLTGDSAALRLGVRVVPVPAASSVFALPRASAGASAYWLSNETQQADESQPSIGAGAAVPKIAAAFTEISRHLLLQAPNAEQVVREELRRAAGAALDAAIFNGSGASGEPLGVASTPGLATFTGASLDQAALRNAQADLATAKAITDPSRVAYVAAPAVAELLAKRQRFTGSDRALWEGSSFDGVVEGVRAVSSASMPASTAILGDWSSLWVAEFAGGLTLEVDPFTKFAAGIVGLRVLLPVDVLMARPAAFTVASSVS